MASSESERIARMRVLFVLPRMLAGGVERATLNLISGLQRRGVACRLALGRCRGELLEEARSLVDVDEVAGCGNGLFVAGLVPVLRRYRPTHVVTAFVDLSLMTLVACRLTGLPVAVIVGVHGTLRREASAGAWRARVQYMLRRQFAGHVYRHSAAVVAVSEGVAADVIERYPDLATRLSVIHNPVFREDMPAVGTEPAGRAPPYRLVALGRLAYEKGFDVLIRAMPEVVRHHAAQLLIFGEGTERPRLQRLIDALELQAQVRLMGPTLDPMTAMAAADVFVFPSRNEGFGVALVEALACGRQIVASDCPHGPAEILRNGEYGQLVTPDDPASLAQAICRSLAGEVIFDPIRLRARAADFSVRTSVDKYLSLFGRFLHQ